MYTDLHVNFCSTKSVITESFQEHMESLFWNSHICWYPAWVADSSNSIGSFLAPSRVILLSMEWFSLIHFGVAYTLLHDRLLKFFGIPLLSSKSCNCTLIFNPEDSACKHDFIVSSVACRNCCTATKHDSSVVSTRICLKSMKNLCTNSIKLVKKLDKLNCLSAF